MSRITRALGHVACFSILAGAMFGLTGCGGSSKTSVTGKVIYKGKAVTFGNVSIVASDGMAHNAIIEENGTFQIPEVATGTAKIGVTSVKPAAPAATDKKAGPGGTGGALKGADKPKRGGAPPATETQSKNWFEIEEKYSDPTTSGLTMTIESGKELVIDIK